MENETKLTGTYNIAITSDQAILLITDFDNEHWVGIWAKDNRNGWRLF
jgi:hypothetical protein